MTDYSEIKAKKSLGQHWLNDLPTLESICSLAELYDKDVILEIGPGYGSLTKLLVKRVDRVIAVELDSTLVASLKASVPDTNLTVVNESILKFDLTTLPKDYKVVANIPYYLTSNLLRLLSESSNPPSRIVLLIQKEVAERVAASPGDMSVLSVTTQYYWEVSLDLLVPSNLFTPPPKVDSQVILLKRRTSSLFKKVNDKDFFRIVKVGFSARRKTLLNSMTNGLRIDKSEVVEILESAGIKPTIRPQELSLDEWYKIYSAYEAKK